MKLILFSLMIPFFVFADSVEKFSCYSNSDSQLEIKIEFDSSVPSLTQTTIKNHGMVTKEVFLSKDSVCGVKLDFAKDCKSQIFYQGGDFNFSFRCDEVFGDLFFLKSAGYSEIRCKGESISEAFEERAFKNCKSIQ